ncbi:MAG: phosphoenolpyruvate synthase [Desulfobacterales bacterium]|nr:MAG: phosphoenolpyruvate synthase [Desulfobacterales bacterium]
MKFGIFGLLRKRRRQASSHDELMEVFNDKYSNFKQILESNSELLKILSDIEQKLRGQAAFGSAYMETQTLRVAFHAGRMIKCLENLSGRPYPALNMAFENILEALNRKQTVAPSKKISAYTLAYTEITRELLNAVGGKSAVLGDVLNRLNLPVPKGFAVTTAAYERFIRANQLDETIGRLKQTVDVVETKTVLQASERIQRLVMAAEVPGDLAREIIAAYDEMAVGRSTGNPRPLVSVRSSATMEDGWLSFAGQYVTVLNVPREGILQAYKRVLASLFAPRAIAYRLHMGIPFAEAAMSVACQAMVACSASGVMYTRNPLNPLENRIIINAVWGLGPYAVDGVVEPDTYVLSKESPPGVWERKIAKKPVRLVPKTGGDVAEEAVPANLIQQPCLPDPQAIRLAEYGMRLEEHLQGPQDVEWALDEDGRLVILQARSLRVEMAGSGAPLANAPPLPGYRVLLEGGDVACPGTACGPAVHVRNEADLGAFPDGGILVARQASAEFVMVMGKARAIVADSGSITGHLAALVKEYLVPTLLNAHDAAAAIAPGTEITVDAYHARIYLGRVPELLEAEPVKATQPSEEYQSLRRQADLIVPLNLFDPKSPRFAPQHCRTMHDIMRYVHEMAYAEIFQLGDLVADHTRLSVRLIAPLPVDLHLIDLGGGLGVYPTATAKVKPEQVTSVPFKAFLRGLLHEGLRSPEPRPVDLRGFLAVMTRQMASTQAAGVERFGDRSFGIITNSYLNFSSRVGYHYSVLDAFCNHTATKNYINFEFKGGAADDLRRNRRARMIARVLSALGFQVKTVEDCVTARFAKRTRQETEDRLDQLGRLLIFTRQMDMLMSEERLVESLASCFLEGNYQLCRSALRE